MNSTEKSLIKLLAQIESFNSDNLLFKPFYHGLTRTMHCFEILVSNRENISEGFAFTFFFDCNTSRIYLEDYGTLYSSQRELTEQIKIYFKEGLQQLKKFLTDYSDLQFSSIQTTSRIPEKFDFLKGVGFQQREQLNHYGNVRFVLELSNIS